MCMCLSCNGWSLVGFFVSSLFLWEASIHLISLMFDFHICHHIHSLMALIISRMRSTQQEVFAASIRMSVTRVIIMSS